LDRKPCTLYVAVNLELGKVRIVCHLGVSCRFEYMQVPQPNTCRAYAYALY